MHGEHVTCKVILTHRSLTQRIDSPAHSLTPGSPAGAPLASRKVSVLTRKYGMNAGQKTQTKPSGLKMRGHSLSLLIYREDPSFHSGAITLKGLTIFNVLLTCQHCSLFR